MVGRHSLAVPLGANMRLSKISRWRWANQAVWLSSSAVLLTRSFRSCNCNEMQFSGIYQSCCILTRFFLCVAFKNDNIYLYLLALDKKSFLAKMIRQIKKLVAYTWRTSRTTNPTRSHYVVCIIVSNSHCSVICRIAPKKHNNGLKDNNVFVDQKQMQQSQKTVRWQPDGSNAKGYIPLIFQSLSEKKLKMWKWYLLGIQNKSIRKTSMLNFVE